MKMTLDEKTLDSLNEEIRHCTKCRLWQSRKIAVPGEGPVPCRVLFIGEAPGNMEDKTGKPFTGMSGKFLDLMLNEIDMKRQQFYITSSVKCRPPKNRPPKDDELAICKENWLNKQIYLIKPQLIVLLGKTALKQMLGLNENLVNCHGRIIDYHGIECLITFHPAASMRFPKIRKEMKKDFQRFKEMINT
ncbi:MAG: Uracil DNA glycosylase superfamily protein [Planctomycetes bacterium ADurb.Bin401]|nr:MAG: Uracil DNA glycosylase superfamily protein [Planctomycetes bacterium ADurb.Bin401]